MAGGFTPRGAGFAIFYRPSERAFQRNAPTWRDFLPENTTHPLLTVTSDESLAGRYDLYALYATPEASFAQVLEQARSNLARTHLALTAKSELAERPANPNCIAPPRPPMGKGIQFERVFPQLEFSAPTQMRQAPGDDTDWYVLEQAGRILRFANQPDTDRVEVLLDARSTTYSKTEAGFIGMAFHPDFSRNGRIFLAHTPDAQPEVTLGDRERVKEVEALVREYRQTG